MGIGQVEATARQLCRPVRTTRFMARAAGATGDSEPQEYTTCSSLLLWPLTSQHTSVFHEPVLQLTHLTFLACPFGYSYHNLAVVSASRPDDVDTILQVI